MQLWRVTGRAFFFFFLAQQVVGPACLSLLARSDNLCVFGGWPRNATHPYIINLKCIFLSSTLLFQPPPEHVKSDSQPAGGAHPSPTWIHFVSAMFWARFCVFGSKATSWHGEFIHANEACTLTSLPSAYGTHTGPLFSPLCRIGVSIIELSGEQLSLGDPGDQTKAEEKKENVDPGKSHGVNPTWNTGLANLKEVGFF